MKKFQLLKLTFIYLLFSSVILASPLVIKKVRYGKTLKGNQLVAKVFSFRNVKPNKAIILTEGVHGNEYIGITKEISKFFETNSLNQNFLSFFKKSGSLIIISEVNKDGVETRSRFNSQGIDLNRHFSANTKNNEAKSLMDFLKVYLSKNEIEPLFAIDYHCCGGKALRPTIKKNQFFYKYLKNSLKYFLGNKFDLINTKELFGKTFKGTLKDFFSEELNTPAITFEAKSLFENSQEKQIQFLENVFKYFSGPKAELAAYNQVNSKSELSLNEYRNLSRNYSE